MTRAIDVEGLTHRFGDGEVAKPVLHGLSIAVEPGEIVLLTGPSGSGKTTLLTLVGALRAVQEGSCRVLGTELAGASEQARVALRRRIGFIFQQHNLLAFLTARQNVAMALEVEAALPEQERLARADAALDAVGLAEKRAAYPATLSGGQRQRVAIARALVHEPGIVLADEPTAALDGRTGGEAMRLLRRLAKERGRSVLLVTHDPRILDIADRVVAMEDGRIVETCGG
jgi:putative ABC transport system ATP-binding protein